MTILEIRAQEERQRQIDHVEQVRRTLRSDYEIEDGVPTPPTWVCVLLAVVFVAGVVWQGGVCW